jgi:hypothetical protein
MESERRSLLPLTNLGTPALVAIVAAVFAGALYLPSYRSPRPEPKALPWDPTVTEARVPALATQDPLDVAYARAKELGFPDKPHGIGVLSDLKDQLAAPSPPQDRVAPHPKSLVLAVSLRSGAWSEDRERRVRTRYAVTAALAQQRFSPRATRELRFALAPQLGEQSIVPYEWFEASAPFEPDDVRPSRVLCLWIDEALLEERPFAKTAAMLEALIASDDRDVAVRFIGPSNSGALLGLLRDAHDVQAALAAQSCATGVAQLYPYWGPLEVVSPMATVPFDAIGGEAASLVHEFEDAPADGCAKKVLELVRAIGQDDELAELLLLELAERIPALMRLDGGQIAWTDSALTRMTKEGLPRDVCVKPSSIFADWAELASLVDFLGFRPISFIPPRRLPVQVALVSEQDTEYGRRWCGTLERERERLARTNPLLNEIEFRFVPYSSVIDGNQLDAPKSADKSKDVGDVSLDDLGASQVDYLRRSERMLSANGGVSAIIALGTDVYDTLMILQALRPAFPGTLFLTTDMDVRVLEPVHQPYTRNLIVATHFDVGAPKDTLRFRDSYQFSTHRAVELVLQGAERELAWRDSGLTPRLFEIGRDAPVELNTDGMDFATRGDRRLPAKQAPTASGWLALLAELLPGAPELLAKEPSSPGSAEPRLHLPAGLLCSCATVLTAFVLIARRPRAPRRREASAFERRVRLSIPYAILFAAAVAIVFGAARVAQMARSHPTEPFEPFAGVSVWPTVLLRLVCTAFCLGSIVFLREELIDAHARIQDAFSLSATKPRMAMVQAWRWLFALPKHDHANPAAATDVWEFVGCWIKSKSWLVLRLLAYVVLCHVLAAPFFKFSNVSSPVRGEFSYVIERFSIFVNVWSFFALICYVLETSFLSHRLIGRLADVAASVLPQQYVQTESMAIGISLDQAEHRGRLLLARAITQVADAQVYFPAIAVGVMVVARANTLDNWSWPAVLIGTLVTFFTMLLLSVLSSHLVAREARVKALDYFRRERLAHAGDAAQRDRLDQLRLEIENLRGGAFSPLIEHPLVRSAFVPLIAWLSAGLIDQGLLTSLMQKL